MKRLLMGLLVCFSVVLVGCSSSSSTGGSSSSTNPVSTGGSNKLVGKWEFVKGENVPPGSVVEFKADGKMTITATGKDAKGKEATMTMEGTYKLDEKEKKVTLSMKGPDGKEDPQTETIVKLTDDQFITKDEKGKETELKKKK